MPTTMTAPHKEIRAAVTSQTPACAVGLAHEIGSIALGFRADFVLLDDDYTVVATIVGGKVVYLRNECRLRTSVG